MSLPISIIETSGTHFQVGEQIGIAARDSIRTMHAETLAEYRDRWAGLIRQTRHSSQKPNNTCRTCSKSARLRSGRWHTAPRLVPDECRRASTKKCAAAFSPLPMGEGAGDEDFGREQRSEKGFSDLSPTERTKGCSDLAAAPPATATGMFGSRTTTIWARVP